MKKVLITGARGGIMAKLIEKIKNDNYFIYATVHTNKEEEILKKQYEDISNIYVFKLDVLDKKDKELLENIDIDILICNAAIGMGGSILEIPIANVRDNFEVNVFSNFEIVQIILKKMIRENKGKIIMMASLAGIMPIEFIGSYAATKASIISLADTMRKELKILKSKVTVSIITPGIYKTGFNEVMLDNKYIWMDKNSYFNKHIAKIKKREYIIFNIMGKKDLDSIVNKIVKAMKDSTNLIYRAPFIEGFFAKIYQMFHS